MKLIQVDSDRHDGHRQTVYDRDWEHLNFSISYPAGSLTVPRPGNLQEMLGVAEKLASFFGFVRVDLYSDGETCMVGEITNMICGGAKNEARSSSPGTFSTSLPNAAWMPDGQQTTFSAIGFPLPDPAACAGRTLPCHHTTSAYCSRCSC